ncbi:MAG: ABC transporter ATP-binding protein, partial [Promethearchaeota archaeon]
MAFIEAIISVLLLFLIVNRLNNWLSEEHQIPKKVNMKNNLISILIVFGISLGIRLPFENLGYYYELFVILNNQPLHFAIMATIFFPFQHIFGRRSNNSIQEIEPNLKETIENPHEIGGRPISKSRLFKKLLVMFIILTWVVAIIYTSFGLLGIEIQKFDLREADILHLGLIWAISMIFILVGLTSMLNRTLSIEIRIPKEVLRNSQIIGSIVSLGIWGIQIVVFEMYLSRLLGIWPFEQDIRVLIGVVSIVYIIVFFIVTKKIYLPKAHERSKLKIQNALDLQKTGQSNYQEGKNVILDVKNLTTYFYTEEGIVRAVEGVSFKILEGEVVGLVGETGCGKSVTALSILQLVRPPGKIIKGEVFFKGKDLMQESEKILQYRGKDITMIFQDPLNSINPVFKVGDQISEVYLLHMEKELLIETINHPEKSIYSIAKDWSINLLRELNIPAPEQIIDRYPHELSGGMRQRVQIAMGLACSPKLLIADEPTTALDVTVQNQILKLMKDLKKKYNTSILFITHDLGIISKMCDRVAVMYSGFIVEYGKIQKLFSKPYHPYTKGLISSVPVVGKKKHRLEIISGLVPNLIYPPTGCRFHPRCKYCFKPCDSEQPKSIEVEPNYYVACYLYDPAYHDKAEISIKKVQEEDKAP